MNLQDTGLPAARRLHATRRLGSRHGLAYRMRAISEALRNRPGLTVLSGGAFIVLAAAVLEALNPGNHWVLFEDISCPVAPATAALAVGIAAWRGNPAARPLRVSLMVSMSLTAAGQTIAVIPDVVHHPIGLLGTLSDVCYVVGAVVGAATLLITLYRRLDRDARLAVLLDGGIITGASMTFVFANWIHQSFLPGSQVADLLSNPTANLLVPLVSALFFASAAAAAVAALSLRVEPSPRGVWAVGIGIVLLAMAWDGWIGRFISGGMDGIEPMDFIFPAGCLMTGWGGVTWTLQQSTGSRYARAARATSDWLPIAGIVGCAILDVMPRSRPLEIDPIAVGTCTVVFFAVARQRALQGRARFATERLSSEMTERAATTVSLSTLEAQSTIEATAEHICAEAMRIDGIDSVVIFGFGPNDVVPVARAGLDCGAIGIGEQLPEFHALTLREHANFGLWLESWAGRTPRDDIERVKIESGLLAEALAPIIWNDEIVGLLALGAASPAHARRLADRLATLTEFSVMSAAVLGPMLSERRQRDTIRAEIANVITTRAFTPVFQPIVDLKTGAFVGYEALTRFDDGTRPDLRFLAADKVEMMVALEQATLREQVRMARNLPIGSFLTLNVSPALVITAGDALMELLLTYDRSAVLEITEHVEIDDYSRLMDALTELRKIAMLAVDDAGAGYAGLRHILELRPQFVKLDISLVRNIDDDPARQAMVTGMAHFAESVGCVLIAEGIETENELAALKKLRIPLGQGYLLARPAPAPQATPETAPRPPVSTRSGKRSRAA